jgi:hypothetical protein
MRIAIRRGIRAFAVLLLLVASMSTRPSRVEALPSGATFVQDAPPPACCFTNRGYAGTCKVTPAKEETCESILNYLNNPSSQGKTYCNSTTVRGGWQSVACAKEQ